ncbi:hypothetical protein [Cellulomonas rhizosphaerae]|uniref:Uncharacterized protein n=1 Tax=Cellulomonas rhizosphaerae TaxID=2293719 RepID=A0A413RP48_9CELL|nr:hypothetical protein [Cellulomonas rhizosphaerae]RHA43680.1 hypothetical protein D1825_05195 [Cellulomonas rhizosphaerae]
MNAGWLTVVGTVVATLGVVWAALAARSASLRSAKVTDEGKFREQLMERVDKLETRVAVVEKQSEARMAFINVLENHIWMGKQPPPPERPSGL